MNKKSHIIFTKAIDTMLPLPCSKFLQIGCILPDILVHTYLVGHTWEASGKKVLRKLERLEDEGSLNIWFSLRLGMLLHYLEDYFTMAHSKYFKGNIRRHILYETKLLHYIREYHYSGQKDFPYMEIGSPEELSGYIVRLQNRYQQEIAKVTDGEKRCFETDLKYMNMAVRSVVGYVIPLMYKKEEQVSCAGTQYLIEKRCG